MVSLLYGTIVHHYINNNLRFCNEINEHGSVYNQTFVALIGDENKKIGFLKGNDCACGDIFGPISSFTLANNLEFLVGGYNTNYREFENLGIESPSILGITPVLGLDFRIPIYENKNFKVTIDNLVSIGTITHALRVDFL